MKKFMFLAILTALLSTSTHVFAASILGANLSSFAVLGGSTVTNIRTSAIVGNVGVSPGSSITGFNSTAGAAVSDPQVTDGLVNTTTPLAASAQAELVAARTNLSNMGAGSTLSADLTGLTILPGVYTVPYAVSNLTGAVTLDGQGIANAIWVFQLPSTLITSSDSIVNFINEGAGSQVFWNVGSSATLGTSSLFEGNILALTSITLNNKATIDCGRALANIGAVTMDMNTITKCTPVPEPSSMVLGLMSLGSILGFRRKKQCLV